MLDKQTKLIQKKYDRFSRFYDLFESVFEKNLYGKWRKDLIGDIKGRILEVGIGTGKNLSYYNKDAKVIGIDISPKMLEKAKMRQKGFEKNITLIQMDAQDMQFEDNSFDYVVCTFVFCSVPDPIKVLKEMKRVCKKNGRILMIEHMLSEHKIIAFFEHIHNPIMRALFGFNINRRTVENIKKSGLEIYRIKNLFFFDVFRKIEIINYNKIA